MLLYRNFCEETFNENCTLKSFDLKYNENYNFGYDVIDVLGKENPNGKAVVWCNPDGDERITPIKILWSFLLRQLTPLKHKALKKATRCFLF